MNTRAFLFAVASLGCLVVAARRAQSADANHRRLVAELIWGTNEGKPPDRELRPVAPELEKKLRRIFKWRSYYGIERKEFAVPDAKPTKIEMSKDCRLEIAHVQGDEYEIQLFGKGVLVVRKRQRILDGETSVIGGDDKNDNAWFVVLTFAKPGGARP